MNAFVQLQAQFPAAIPASLDTGIDNANQLGFKIIGVLLIVIGGGIIWASRSGKFGKVLGQVGIIAIGFFVILLGVGGAAAGTAVGREILAFFGLA